jgi:hypothetical protein
MVSSDTCRRFGDTHAAHRSVRETNPKQQHNGMIIYPGKSRAVQEEVEVGGQTHGACTSEPSLSHHVRSIQSKLHPFAADRLAA